MLFQSNILISFFILRIKLVNSFTCEIDGFFPDKRDCWVYHICDGTSHTIKACKDDLLFNPIKNECDWPMNVNCTSTTNENPRTAEIVQISETNSSSPLDYLCQFVDNDYIAHPNDCKRYAYCANGVPQSKSCKKTLMWSQTEKMCVWPAQSDCPLKFTTTTTTTTTVIVNTSPISQKATYPASYILTGVPPLISSFDPSKLSTVCPLTKSGRIPDPYDCTIYHDCYQGTDLVSYCPAQFQYNPEKQKCDYAQNVQCKNKCTQKNEGARFIDPNSCCHYYQCISNKLIPQICSQPNLFDMQTRQCLPYKKVNCDGRRQCLNKCHYLLNHGLGKNQCDSSLSCATHSDGFYLDRTKPNCQWYIHCQDHRVVNHSRCSYSQRFNRNMGRCTPADQVPCLASKLNRISSIMFILLLVLNINQRYY